ncbi:MAG: hypothetical protein QM564_13270 [Bergeyella sp.]
MKIGLSFNQLMDVKSEIREELKDNSAFNCGDFDKAFHAIVNKTLEKIQVNSESIMEQLQQQEKEILNTLERIDRLHFIRDDYRPLGIMKGRMFGLMDVAELIGVETEQYKWIENV